MSEILSNSDRQRAIWSAGDFHLIGVGQLIVGEILCEEGQSVSEGDTLVVLE